MSRAKVSKIPGGNGVEGRSVLRRKKIQGTKSGVSGKGLKKTSVTIETKGSSPVSRGMSMGMEMASKIVLRRSLIEFERFHDETAKYLRELGTSLARESNRIESMNDDEALRFPPETFGAIIHETNTNVNSGNAQGEFTWVQPRA